MPGVDDLKGLLGLLKSRQGKASFASYSAGTSSHYAGLILNQKTGLDLQHVPFPGSSPALTQVMGGQIEMMFDGIATSLPFIKAGKLKVYGFTGKRRSPYLPDVPTLTELGYPDIQFMGWLGVIATSGGFGRSRATRMAVEPDEVQQMIADNSSVSAICRAASAMASAPVASGSVRCASMIER